MKKTLKEKIRNEKGISLVTGIIISLVIIIAISIIIFVGIKITQKSTEQNVSGKTDGKTNKSSETAKKEDLGEYWYEKYLNIEQKEKCDLALFDKKFTGPINLLTADSFVKKYKLYIDGLGTEAQVSTISNLLNMENTIKRECHVYMYYGEEYELNKYSRSLELYITNYSEEELSIKECYEKGWWYMKGSNILGIIANASSTSTNSSYNKSYYLDEVVKNLGAPKHIYSLLERKGADFKDQSYIIDYQFEGFDILIDVWDSPQDDAVKVEGIKYSTNVDTQMTINKMQKDFKDFKIVK